jgi:hypothetical protein
MTYIACHIAVPTFFEIGVAIYLPFGHSPLEITVSIFFDEQMLAFISHSFPYILPSEPHIGIHCKVQAI